MCVPSSSQGEYQQNGRWFAELNELHGQNDIDQQEGEHNIFHDGEEEITGNGVSEIHSDIQQCLSLNRDYQVILLFNIVFNLTGPLSLLNPLSKATKVSRFSWTEKRKWL